MGADAGPDGLVTLTGFRFSERLRLAVDLRRSLLVLQDEVLVGRPIDGTSPIFGPFTGVTFEAEGWGRVSGQASILALADGRLAFDFDHLEVDGRRAREYGAVAPERR